MTTTAQPPGSATTGPTRRRWLIVATVAWALVLLAGVAYSYHRDEPTVREQRSIEQALPVVDGAAAEIVRAAQPEGVAVLHPPRLTPGCRITAARAGAELEREITVHAPAGGGPGVLDRLRQRLPDSYAVRLRSGDDGRPDALRADAGEFVWLRGTVATPGVVRLVVGTGCRPYSPDLVLAENAMGRPADEVPRRVLAALGAAGDSSTGTTAGCPGGGVVHTATAQGRPAATPGRLAAAAAPPPGAAVVVDEPDRLAYRHDAFAVVVERIDDDRVRASATSSC